MAPSSILGYPNVRFSDRAQKNNFLKLMELPIVCTRFLDEGVLQHLGLADAMRDFMVGTRTVGLFDMRADTYTDLTLEFLSSFSYSESDGMVHFRLCAESKHISLEEFGACLGIGADGQYVAPKGSQYDNWMAIAGSRPSSNQKLRTSQIHHPVIRIWARLVTFVLFPRNDPDYLKRVETDMICAYLNAHRGAHFVINVAHHVCTTLENVATGKLGALYGGGLATILAEHLVPGFTPQGLRFEIENEGDQLDQSRFSLSTMLTYTHWLRRRPRHMTQYYWLVGQDETVILPLPSQYSSFMTLPILFGSTFSHGSRREVPDFTLRRGPIEEWIALEYHTPSFVPQQDPPHGFDIGQGSHGVRHNQPGFQTHRYTYPAENMPTNFNQYGYETKPDVWDMNTIGEYMHNMSIQNTKVANDNALAMYPFYDNACRQGYIAPTYSHPGYYNYPQDSNFGPCSYGTGFPQGYMGPFGGDRVGQASGAGPSRPSDSRKRHARDSPSGSFVPPSSEPVVIPSDEDDDDASIDREFGDDDDQEQEGSAAMDDSDDEDDA